MPRRPPPTKPPRKPLPEEMAKDAIAHDEGVGGDKVRMTFRVILGREQAEALGGRGADGRHKREGQVQLISRPGRDRTKRFPALVAAIAALPLSTLILDGEVCIFDQRLVSRFEWLRHGKPPGVATPPIFMAFDCFYVAGRDLRELELGARRDWLEDVLAGQLLLPARRLADAGLMAWAEVLKRGYEGRWRRIRRRPTAAAEPSRG